MSIFKHVIIEISKRLKSPMSYMSTVLGEPTWEDKKRPISVIRDTAGITSVFLNHMLENEMELKLEDAIWQTLTWEKNTEEISIPAPVQVKKVGNTEQLIYRTSEMTLNKLYPIKWNNEDYAIMKNEKEVEIFKFYPDIK